jgi:SSS family solute:Na+ symporter
MIFTSPTLLATGETIGSDSLDMGVRVHLNAVDIAVAVIYLIGIVMVGLFAAWRHKKNQGAAEEFFLAGKSLG